LRRWASPWTGIVIGFYCLIAIAGFIAMASYAPDPEESEGGSVGGITYDIVLRPMAWPARRLPLDKYLHDIQPLYRGKWIVILYHATCIHCVDVVAKYERYARESYRKPGATRIALIEVPPLVRVPRKVIISPRSHCFCRRLSQTKTWYCETPVILRVENGECRELLAPDELVPSP
jgi:hypothetical protein